MRGYTVRRIIDIALVAGLLICCLGACSGNAVYADEAKKLDFFSMELSQLEKYVSVGAYKGINVSAGEGSRGDAVWQAILEGSGVIEYPQEHVYYYVEQLQAQYGYYAEQAGVSYEEMLRQLGLDEGDILAEAKALTKSDVVYAIIVKKEGISVSATEKQQLFSKYVDKYVAEYGYTKEYVESNMSDEIYGSMLYDKTTEFLIVNNSFN